MSILQLVYIYIYICIRAYMLDITYIENSRSNKEKNSTSLTLNRIIGKLNFAPLIFAIIIEFIEGMAGGGE